jgi:hypothetical protein
MVAFAAYRSSCLAIRFEKHPCDAIREKPAQSLAQTRTGANRYDDLAIWEE